MTPRPSDSDSDDDSVLDALPSLASLLKPGKKSLPKEEKVETKAAKDPEPTVDDQAQSLVAIQPTHRVERLKDLSTTLRFHKFSLKKRKFCLPCIIVENHDEAMHLDHINITATKNTLIRYLGIYHEYADHLQAVPETSLFAYCQEDTPTEWDAELLQEYIKCIGDMKEMKGELVKLKVEELFLDKVLKAAIESSRQFQEKIANLKPPPPVEAMTDNEESEKEEELIEIPRRPVVSKRKPVKVDGPKPRLRAGDKIRYFHPVRVATEENKVEGRIKSVVTGSTTLDAVVLFMDNHIHVPRGHQVMVIERYNRGKLSIVKDPEMLDISQYRLDTSMNDKVELEDQHKQVKEFFKTSCADMQNEADAHLQKIVTQDTDEEMARNEENVNPQDDESIPPKSPDIVRRRLSDFAKRKSTEGSETKSARPLKIFRSTRQVWEKDLNDTLKQIRETQKKRRYDHDVVDANGVCCETALTVRARLEDLAKERNETEKDIVADLEDDFDFDEESLWNYLGGNRGNILHYKKLNALTAKWKEWLCSTND